MSEDLTTQHGVAEWAGSQFGAGITVEPLSGGLVNYVWRLVGEALPGGRAVLKHAATTLSSAPDVPLAPSRLSFEADALKTFREPLDFRFARFVQLPIVYLFDEPRSALLMQDMAPRFGPMRFNAAKPIGEFIGKLHMLTRDNTELARRFDNHDVQVVRQRSQYEQVQPWLEAFGDSDAAAVGAIATRFGASLCEPGECIVMGDLWPNAILSDRNALNCTLIDWEFVHYGRPAQDVGHLAAHLWMHRHGYGRPFENDTEGWNGTSFWFEFRRAYQAANDEWDGEFEREISIHAGCEMLSRTIGPLSERYSGYSLDRIRRYLDDPTAQDDESGQYRIHADRNVLPTIEYAKQLILGERDLEISGRHA